VIQKKVAMIATLVYKIPKIWSLLLFLFSFISFGKVTLVPSVETQHAASLLYYLSQALLAL